MMTWGRVGKWHKQTGESKAAKWTFGSCWADNDVRRIPAMRVTIELPDDLADQIRMSSGDVPRRVLEAFAIDSYRSGNLSGWQARRLLGLETRFELDALLKRAGVFREYTAEELESDYEASRAARAENLVSRP
jgi:predicted HTH domain antitoxin